MAVQARIPIGGLVADLDEQQLRLMSLIGYQQMLNGAVFSGGQQQQSDLTCNGNNASAVRKRSRDQFLEKTGGGVHQCLYNGDSRLEQSAMTSTSGRSMSSSTVAAAPPTRDNLISCFYHQNLEVEALVRVQTERLRSELQNASKRHCTALISVFERQIQRRLAEKDAELERVNRKNLELEEKFKQIAMENQIWFSVARNNEAVVSSLRSSLEQALLQQNVNTADEGFGDSGGGDEESCCYDEAEKLKKEAFPTVVAEKERQKKCRVCGNCDVCVLLLPCRHLCLCTSCESKIDTCPICNSTTNASVHVFMS